MVIHGMFFIPETQLDGSVALGQISNLTSVSYFLYVLDMIDIPLTDKTLSFCLPSLRDKPNVLYFDILKCATSINIMATALNGLQCPTTQVDEAASFL